MRGEREEERKGGEGMEKCWKERREYEIWDGGRRREERGGEENTCNGKR